MKENTIQCLGPHGFHRMHYTEWGDADNPHVLLCVHGLTRTGRDFDEFAAAMAKDYRVLCPDVAGRGKSEWLTHKKDYGYPLYCSDMAALIARSGAQTVDWVGTSMGGIIGMVMAAQPNNPIRRFVINDVGPQIPKTALGRLKNYVGKDPRFASLDEAEMYVRMVSEPFGALTDPQWRHLTETSVRTHDDGSIGLMYDPAIALAFAGPGVDLDMWMYWDPIRCPTLALRGADSDLLLHETALEMTRRGPRAKLVEFPNVGHAPMLMCSDQVEVVREFLLCE
ncbi:MAG TPA: alpha/beta hydrolase [Burkholderiales bacterium]|nr:alpha/beta hydrolase [Burkholderiales bacterium]